MTKEVERIAVCETKITNVETKVDKMLDNHLPHLRKQMFQIMFLVFTGLLIPIVLYIIER